MTKGALEDGEDFMGNKEVRISFGGKLPLFPRTSFFHLPKGEHEGIKAGTESRRTGHTSYQLFISTKERLQGKWKSINLQNATFQSCYLKNYQVIH